MGVRIGPGRTEALDVDIDQSTQCIDQVRHVHTGPAINIGRPFAGKDGNLHLNAANSSPCAHCRA